MKRISKWVLQCCIMIQSMFYPAFGQNQVIDLVAWKQDLYQNMQLITDYYKQEYSYFSLFEGPLLMKAYNIDALDLQEVSALCDTAMTLNPLKKWKKMYISYYVCDACEGFSYEILIIFVSENKVWGFRGSAYVLNYKIRELNKIVHITKYYLKHGYTPPEAIGSGFLALSEFNRNFKLLRSFVFLDFIGWGHNLEFSSRKFRKENPEAFDNTN